MVGDVKKLRLLEIDTKSFLPLTPLTPCAEEDNDVKTLTYERPPVNTRRNTFNTVASKTYSMSFLHSGSSSIDQHGTLLTREQDDSTVNLHKRSTSAGNESIMLPRNSSVPDFLSKTSSIDSKNSKGSSSKKKWFQIPRMTLKRQVSTPPRRGYGGLKAGLVEPPEPPPQLLFNLDWSSKSSSTPLLWDNDVSNRSISTPNSPNINRRYSGYGLEVILSQKRDLTAGITTDDIPSDDVKLARRLSCPNYENLLSSSTSNSGDESVPESPVTPHTPPLTPNDLISNKSRFLGCSRFSNFQKQTIKRGVSDDGHGVIPSASSSISSVASNTPSLSPLPSPKLTSSDDYKPLLLKVNSPITNETVMNFGNVKPRTHKLKRKMQPKLEHKALNTWQIELMVELNNIKSPPRYRAITEEKKERYFLTRKFILREFYTTEINFWNQLNFTKVMFCDSILLAIDRHSDMTKPSDMDWFANLHDLMKFSFTLILRLRNTHMDRHGVICQDTIAESDCQTCPTEVNIGLILREMAEKMVVFLRCALDYRANRKLLDQKVHNKAYALYNEKLALRKETRQFTLHDYLIIPIQRITRYGLLLADLEKHTESTHVDYENIKIARCIVRSLAIAMNSAQKK